MKSLTWLVGRLPPAFRPPDKVHAQLGSPVIPRPPWLEGLQHCLRRIDSGEPADSPHKRFDARLIGPVFAWATIMCGNYCAIYEGRERNGLFLDALA